MSNRKCKIRTAVSYAILLVILTFLTCISTESIVVRTLFSLTHVYCLLLAGIDSYYWNQTISNLPADLEGIIKNIDLSQYHFFSSLRNITICFGMLFILQAYEARDNLYEMVSIIFFSIFVSGLIIYFHIKASKYANNIFESTRQSQN